MSNTGKQSTNVDWKQLAKQKPREIVLSGEHISKQIEEENGLNELVYRISSLNFLEITNTVSLTTIEPNVCQLTNLTILVLQGNKLSSVPVEIGKLTKLKCLDLSRNEINELPDKLFEQLTNLQSLNVEQNKLSALPDLSHLESLLILKCGSNQIEHFPSSLCDSIYKKLAESQHSPIPIFGGGAVHLAEIFASHNQIDSIPSSIGKLAALKTIDLSDNQIKLIPHELVNCSKLKDVNFKENPVKDRRLYKLIEQCPTKKVLDYVRANVAPSKVENQASLSAKTDGEDLSNDSQQASDCTTDRIITIVPSNEPFKVLASKQILQMRKIVGCILHNVDLSNAKVLRKFLAIQTKLHQGLCDNRQKATIATHDLAKIIPTPTYATKMANVVKPTAQPLPPPPPKVVYFEGRVPTKVRLVPLGRANPMTGMELYRLLNEEADQHRKEKKRNAISGIHKYIHLLKGKQLYPVLLDSFENVLSLPPLTNSEYSKISSSTTSVLVEVTGESVPTCRTVMNELIYSFLTLEVPSDNDTDSCATLTLFNSKTATVCDLSKGTTEGNKKATDTSVQQYLTIEPVIVETVDTNELVVKYPAKIDLQFENVSVQTKSN